MLILSGTIRDRILGAIFGANPIGDECQVQILLGTNLTSKLSIDRFGSELELHRIQLKAQLFQALVSSP